MSHGGLRPFRAAVVRTTCPPSKELPGLEREQRKLRLFRTAETEALEKLKLELSELF